MRIRLGFAMTGSFCTFAEAFRAMERLAASDRFDLYPIFSENAATLDTRFGTAAAHLARAAEICGRPVVHTLPAVEPIGPRRTLDLLLIAPCTGNTAAKIACGIADTAVTLAAKAHLRNERPLVIAISSNDALATGARNIGTLINRRGHYLVPLRQDDPLQKPRSLVADFDLIEPTIDAALAGLQIEPMLL